MPIYVYKCECGHSFEELLPMPGEQKTPCPKCGCQAGRVISGCSLSFKGPGFYCNDYPKQKGKPVTEEKEDN